MKDKKRIKLSEVSEDTSKYSRKASELSHKLLIAGIVVVWVISNGGNTGFHSTVIFDKVLLWALLFFVLGLAFAIAHYFVTATLLEYFYHNEIRKQKLQNAEAIMNHEVDEPTKIEIFTWVCFYSKHITLIVGYILIIYYLITNL